MIPPFNGSDDKLLLLVEEELGKPRSCIVLKVCVFLFSCRRFRILFLPYSDEMKQALFHSCLIFTLKRHKYMQIYRVSYFNEGLFLVLAKFVILRAHIRP